MNIALLVLALAVSASAETINYGEFSLNNVLGCHQSAWPPMTISEIGTTFKLYTSSTPNGVSVSSGSVAAGKSGFNSAANTYFFTHGYNSNSEGGNSFDIYDAYIDTEGANVIAVDWRNGANVANYNKARQNIRIVGNLIALFAEDLGQSFSKIKFAGHSLGAHASGYAGEALKAKGYTVSRITGTSAHSLKYPLMTDSPPVGLYHVLIGLDPAGPGFTSESNSKCRLDSSDADFVDNIHTDDDTYGTSTDMGHVDFYPNGGSSQPGCVTDIASCSHSKVKLYYEESIRATTCKFTSYQCSSWANYNNCNSCGSFTGCCNFMGYHATSSCTGRRYVKTNANPQYCIS